MVNEWLTSATTCDLTPARRRRARRSNGASATRPVAYDAALAAMEARVAAIAAGDAPELVWLLEHPPLYTAGTSAQRRRPARGALSGHRGRPRRAVHLSRARPAGGLCDARPEAPRRPTCARFVATLEEWIIRTLAAFNVRGERREDRIGVWVRAAGQGRRLRGQDRRDRHPRCKRWVTLHGIALNVEPDLSHFSGIVPCGVAEQRYGVTSLADLGHAGDHGRRSTWRCGGNSRACSETHSN